ncbi:MAG TPA: hypothetical protein VEI55_05675 [Candidatus Acidoferrum sp.]|nr:hypothetical protein [Candidatus Acidoferrum sp.]
MSKLLTREQLQSRKDKAVRFVRDVLGDSDRADEIEDESLESYAERRKIQIANPRKIGGAANVPRKPTRDELVEENDQLWDTIENIHQELGDLLEEDGEETEGEDDGEDES